MVNVRVTSKNFALVLKSAETLPERIDAAAGKGLAAGLEYTVSVAQEQYLSGPRPYRLDVRTQRLRNSVTSKVEKSSRGWLGRIGTNVAYGAFHEFGFHGEQNVRAHTRVNRVFNAATGQNVEIRRSFKDRFDTFIGFKESNSRALARIRESKTGSKFIRKNFLFSNSQNVRAHTRTVNYAGRPFVRPALEIYGIPGITAAIEREVAKVQ